MIVWKKITSYEPSELEIKGATLLSADEARKLPLRLRQYNDWWWLRSPGWDSNYAVSVNPDGSVFSHGGFVNFGIDAIRPALQLKNLESSNLEIGDAFEFGGKEFEIISDTLAFCTTDIGKHRFDADSNDYEQSEIKQYVDAWFDECSRRAK